MSDLRRVTGPRAMSVPEFAYLNGISTSTVWRLIARGEVLTFKIGGQRRIRADVLEKLQSGAATG